MSSSVNPIPSGFHTLTPHLVVSDSRQAADFYKKAFGAEILGLAEGPDGKIIHAAGRIGDSMFMFNDEFPDWGVLSPATSKSKSPVTVHLYVDDADKLFAQAVAAGAVVTMPLADQFWGDRYGTLQDPFGHHWAVATHIKDLSHEEMKAAMDEAMAKMGSHA
ncbi:MAG TPA: VOC family protein [Candidatus Bathyarchaeia archaeon]|nr:VOC family protein [Candidatus Bathyarchaeia archaeon]